MCAADGLAPREGRPGSDETEPRRCRLCMSRVLSSENVHLCSDPERNNKHRECNGVEMAVVC